MSTMGIPAGTPIEIVERKGLGHPDTLSDALGEHLSCTYSNYTRTRFGAILRHQFDKVALMCGRAKVSFGAGEMLEPIRVRGQLEPVDPERLHPQLPPHEVHR